MREDFILELHKDLTKFQLSVVLYEELRPFTEDIGKHLREGTEDLETNHKAIGMKCLFRRFSIK